MSRGNGTRPPAIVTPPAHTIAYHLLDAGARSVGLGSMRWVDQILPRVEKSGPVSQAPMGKHVFEMRRNLEQLATHAVLMVDHRQVAGNDVDSTDVMIRRGYLQEIAGHAAAIENALRLLDRVARE